MVGSAERKVMSAAGYVGIPRAIQPGATLGVMGGGQLGAMFAMAAKRMGYRVEAFSDVADCPAAKHSDRVHVGSYDDPAALVAMARGLDVLTFEFENVSAEPLRALAGVVPVRPAPEVLFTTQDRGREKAFLVREGFACAPHRLVRSREELHAAVAALGLPAVLKTAAFGYDGKGQRKLEAGAGPQQIDAAWESLGGDAADRLRDDAGECLLILEGWIDFLLWRRGGSMVPRRYSPRRGIITVTTFSTSRPCRRGCPMPSSRRPGRWLRRCSKSCK
jgi:phosphoribosylaminoimidazole carboxylase (NCAIR synthetase)